MIGLVRLEVSGTHLWMSLDDRLSSCSVWLFGVCPEELIIVAGRRNRSLLCFCLVERRFTGGCTLWTVDRSDCSD